MHDCMSYDPIVGQSQSHESLKVGNSLIFRICLCIFSGSWQVAAQSYTLVILISTFSVAIFLISVLVFVSHMTVNLDKSSHITF